MDSKYKMDNLLNLLSPYVRFTGKQNKERMHKGSISFFINIT